MVVTLVQCLFQFTDALFELCYFGTNPWIRQFERVIITLATPCRAVIHERWLPVVIALWVSHDGSSMVKPGSKLGFSMRGQYPRGLHTTRVVPIVVSTESWVWP